MTIGYNLFPTSTILFFVYHLYVMLQFVTRAVRVIDLITNIDMQAFQMHGGLTSFISRLEVSLKYEVLLFYVIVYMICIIRE